MIILDIHINFRGSPEHTQKWWFPIEISLFWETMFRMWIFQGCNTSIFIFSPYHTEMHSLTSFLRFIYKICRKSRKTQEFSREPFILLRFAMDRWISKHYHHFLEVLPWIQIIIFEYLCSISRVVTPLHQLGALFWGESWHGLPWVKLGYGRFLKVGKWGVLHLEIMGSLGISHWNTGSTPPNR